MMICLDISDDLDAEDIGIVIAYAKDIVKESVEWLLADRKYTDAVTEAEYGRE